MTPIDVATNTAGTPIAVGDDPSVSPSPPTGTAYVVNQFSNDVTPIDVATNTAGTPSTVGDGPYAVAVTPDGTTAYVTNALSDDVTPIDVASTPPAPHPRRQRSGRRRRHPGRGHGLRQPTSCSDSVTPIDVATNSAGAPDPRRRLAVRRRRHPRRGHRVRRQCVRLGVVTPIDVATNTAGTPIAVGDDSAGVAVTPDGVTAYVANHGASRHPDRRGHKHRRHADPRRRRSARDRRHPGPGACGRIDGDAGTGGFAERVRCLGVDGPVRHDRRLRLGFR